MKKNIVITAGPTREKLDEVMEITNFSSGALGATIATDFITNKADSIEKIYYLSDKQARKPQIESDKIEYVPVHSTDDLLKAIRFILTKYRIDAVIHSAAVGDYKGRYCTTAPMLAEELAQFAFQNHLSIEELQQGILSILRNPQMKVSSEHKISSYEPDLMFTLDLTPKVIKEIKPLAPEADLIGFKLLHGVPHEELIDVAAKSRVTNQAKYIIANDLADIRNGRHPAYFVGENGVEYTCETKEEIAQTLRRVLFK